MTDQGYDHYKLEVKDGKVIETINGREKVMNTADFIYNILNNTSYIYLRPESEWKNGEPAMNIKHEPFNSQLDNNKIPISICFTPTLPLVEGSVDENGYYNYAWSGVVEDPDLVQHTTEEWQNINHNQTTLIARVNPMDNRYPHTCFKCGMVLLWIHLLERNECDDRLYKKTYEKWKWLKRLWRSPYISFYCCSCYREMME